MENNKNIASLVSSHPDSVSLMLMIKAAGDAPLFIPMKMIEDLGRQYPCEKSKSKTHMAIYECPLCGRPFRTRVSAIEHGIIKSCHCQNAKLFIERSTKHGLCKHPLYNVFRAMGQRCLNANDKAYSEWGGRGIIICNEWRGNFIGFYNWAIENGYKEGLLLDRKNNDLGYCPENCRWVTCQISNENTRLLRSTNTSGYRGINFIKTGKRFKRWEMSIMVGRKKYHQGYYLTAKEAAQAYNDFVIEHGTAHPLNIIK
jgi:hypothetical protein